MDTIEMLTRNINPGIEYEIAIASCLANFSQQQFYEEVISKHPKSQKIREIVTKIKIPLAKVSFRNDCGLNYTGVESVSQDDSVGPSDLILHYADKSRLGLSIKYQNTCNLNITGGEFLNKSTILNLKAVLPQYTSMYIAEMNELYGPVNNWFRQRKPSKITDRYIDLIRDEILREWSEMPYDKKDRIISRLFHESSPIRFWILYLHNRNGGFEIEMDNDPIKVANSSLITLEKYQTSYILFTKNLKGIGKMQVKFNNGFLENCKGRSYDVSKDGVLMKFGQPFSSWNFSII